jgi:hypothetical protein
MTKKRAVSNIRVKDVQYRCVPRRPRRLTQKSREKCMGCPEERRHRPSRAVPTPEPERRFQPRGPSMILTSGCSGRALSSATPTARHWGTSTSLIGHLGSSAFRLSTHHTESMSLAGSRFSSESAPRPLSIHPPLQSRCRSRARASLRNRHRGPCMELSLSRSLLGSKSFVLRHFFCSISKTVSSLDPHFALVDARSRLAVAPTLRHAPPLPGHTLTASRATARLRGRDND